MVGLILGFMIYHQAKLYGRQTAKVSLNHRFSCLLQSNLIHLFKLPIRKAKELSIGLNCSVQMTHTKDTRWEMVSMLGSSSRQMGSECFARLVVHARLRIFG